MAETLRDPHAEQAAAFARAAAGDDETAYLQLFTVAYNAAHRVSEADDPKEVTAALLERMSEQPSSGARGHLAAPAAAPAPDPDSIWLDPVFVANQKLVIRDEARLVGSKPTKDFSDCVAVGRGDSWCCSGTLIAPNVVVSAAHCPILARCSERIFVGEDVSKSEQGRIVNVKQTTVHPGYSQHDPFDDLTVLVLEESVDGVAPRRVASPETLADVATVRLVGFGSTDTYGSTGYGIRRLVDVGLASQDPKYGANPKSEFVAGAPFLDRDSCSGDSGGPAYIDVSGAWQLAGATSRSTKTALRKCGDGGVYTWVSVYRDWITSVGGPLS